MAGSLAPFALAAEQFPLIRYDTERKKKDKSRGLEKEWKRAKERE